MKSRRINCPEYKEGRKYIARCIDTGEVLECGELAPLLRQIASQLDTADTGVINTFDPYNWRIGVAPTD